MARPMDGSEGEAPLELSHIASHLTAWRGTKQDYLTLRKDNTSCIMHRGRHNATGKREATDKPSYLVVGITPLLPTRPSHLVACLLVKLSYTPKHTAQTH